LLACSRQVRTGLLHGKETLLHPDLAMTMTVVQIIGLELFLAPEPLHSPQLTSTGMRFWSLVSGNGFFQC